MTPSSQNLHHSPRFLGPGLALPTGSLSTEEFAEFAVRLCATTAREQSLVRTVARQSGIHRRHSVLASDAGSLPFFTAPPFERGAPPPGTDARMNIYEEQAPILALKAARDVLTTQEISSESVTHVITVSCTGFMAPGLDYHLVRELGLPVITPRLHLGFMGCHAALNAFGAARAICLAHPDAVVLVALVELCTLHFQAGVGRDALLPNALFADGAAAFVIAGCETASAIRARYALTGTNSRLIPDTDRLMTWRVGDEGFRMTLDSAVPKVIGRELPGFANRCRWDAQDAATAWAVHPGGPRILEQVEEVLALPEDALLASREVLRRHGNMSSATLLFILRELLAANPETIRMLAFGPGLNVEGGTLQRVS